MDDLVNYCKRQNPKIHPVIKKAKKSKQIVPDQTAPTGAVCSGTTLFAHAFPV